MITDPEYKIGRPRQLYNGPARRDVPVMKPKASPTGKKGLATAH